MGTIIDASDTYGPRHRRAALLLIGLVLLLDLPGLWSLPPMDRDEPRFAQASKQMLETGDYIDIRFQDEARNKKPVGIYWLQAAAVAAGEAVGVDDARRAIWLYRLPSLLGAVVAVLATYWTALALTTCRAALGAASLFAATVILSVESHLAKTDAALLATIVVAMGALARVFTRQRDEHTVDTEPALAVVFWVAVGAGVLIKGPITPMVPLFAAIVLSVRARSARWLLALRPWLGLGIVALMVLPWLVLILIRTHGTFLADSVGHDMLGKVAGAQEAHGAPPGTYLAAFWVTAWPLAPFALVAAPAVWARRREAAVAFLLAWIVPTWLLFELVPTKLPHYVMPVYPAVAILAALALDAGARPSRPWLVFWTTLSLLAVLPVVVAAALLFGHGFLWTHLPVAARLSGFAVVALALAAATLAARRLQEGAVPAAFGLAVGGAAIVNLFVFGYLLRPSVSDLLAVSGHLARVERDAAADLGCGHVAVATAGDHEPSLVFLTGTDLLLTSPTGAADFLRQDGCRIALVESRDEGAFRAVLGDTPDARLAIRVPGTAINGGKHLDIGVYVRQKNRQ